MRFSIIVAAHNEGSTLCRTVESSIQSIGAAEADYELIVADDASWDGSVEETVGRFPRVRVVRHEERRGASPAKRLGAQNAWGKVLVFLDGHCQPKGNALLRLVEDVEYLKGEAVVTPAVPSLDAQSWENSAWQVGHGYHLSLETFDCGWLPLDELKPWRRGPRKFYESPALIGCALAVSRDLYDELRGFDPDMLFWGVEDLDFGLKCWTMGHPILHDPEAVVGHRFRAAFDNYEVPFEHLLVNQLRMARKNFTYSVWCDWVERCRRRHAGRLGEHPEGLWAHAWQLFQQRLASADAERAHVQGRRVRDEFWYAERFGLAWPRIGSQQLSEPRVTLEADQPTAAASPSPPPEKRVILILGYWPPTDIGVDHERTVPERWPNMLNEVVFEKVSGHGMLWGWKDRKSYRGYKLVVVTPTFHQEVGWTAVGDENGNYAGYGPYWGKGAGSITVDYNVTASFFWKTVKALKPITIMSFSRGNGDNSWNLENYGTNLAHDNWRTVLDFMTNTGPKSQDWFKQPIIGGTHQDPSPYKGKGKRKGDPPDRSIAADTELDSELPFDAIIAALNEKMATEIGDGSLAPDRHNGAGDFVSNYMALLVAWYRLWWKQQNKGEECVFSGHTHVGVFVKREIAARAFKIQLDTVIDELKKQEK